MNIQFLCLSDTVCVLAGTDQTTSITLAGSRLYIPSFNPDIKLRLRAGQVGGEKCSAGPAGNGL